MRDEHVRPDVASGTNRYARQPGKCRNEYVALGLRASQMRTEHIICSYVHLQCHIGVDRRLCAASDWSLQGGRS